MNPTARIFQSVILRPSARRISLLPLVRRPPTVPKLRTRARFFAEGPAPKPNAASKQRLSTHAMATEAEVMSHAEDPIAREKTLSGRLKALIKTYGWYALGVYSVLTVLDFGVAFALVQLLGKDKVAVATHWVKEKVMAVVGDWWPEKAENKHVEDAVDAATGAQSGAAGAVDGRAGLWGAVVLAYGIHKTLFLPIRVGLTAGITPRFVKWLTSKGWVGVAGTKRAAEAARQQIQKRNIKD